MNRSLYLFTLLALAVCIVIGASSCRKSAYPRETYRGAGHRYSNTNPVRSNRIKAKSYRPYKAVRAKSTKY